MQVEYKTETGTVLFVKVPEESKSHLISKEYLGCEWLEYPDNTGCTKIPLHKGNWQLIGLTSEVTEEQAKMMLPTEKKRHPELNLYIDYNEESTRYAYLLKKALDSFKYLMHHLQVYEVNPLPDPENTMRQGNGFFYYMAEDEDFEEYARIESRTGKWVVLFKSNEKL